MGTASWLPVFAREGHATGFRLRGSGWSLTLVDGDLAFLTERLRVAGHWAVVEAIESQRRMNGHELVLSREQKSCLLRALTAMRDTVLLPESLRRLRDNLECDVYSYYG